MTECNICRVLDASSWYTRFYLWAFYGISKSNHEVECDETSEQTPSPFMCPLHGEDCTWLVHEADSPFEDPPLREIDGPLMPRHLHQEVDRAARPRSLRSHVSHDLMH